MYLYFDQLHIDQSLLNLWLQSSVVRGHLRWVQWQRICLPMQEVQETQILSLGQEDPGEQKMVAHSNILAWGIPWTEEPGNPWGCKGLDTNKEPISYNNKLMKSKDKYCYLRSQKIIFFLISICRSMCVCDLVTDHFQR